jgi:hypothetical protein
MHTIATTAANSKGKIPRLLLRVLFLWGLLQRVNTACMLYCTYSSIAFLEIKLQANNTTYGASKRHSN